MNNKKILVFAGTTEGRQFVETIANGGNGIDCYVSVATDYGKLLLPQHLSNVNILSGRMTKDQMIANIKEYQFDLIVDATHPYAVEVTKNIKEACAACQLDYVRLLRSIKGSTSEGNETEEHASKDSIYVNDTKEAISFLNQTEGNVLLTTGSKELDAYTDVMGFEKRLFPRVLPTVEVVEKCWRLGFTAKQLICMQGPFTYASNFALLKQINAKYLVTKETGTIGGFEEKCRAARDAGVTLIIIKQKVEESGLQFDEVIQLLKQKYGLSMDNENNEFIKSTKGTWFPFFVNFSDKKVLIIGAGKIALRRMNTLLQFDCKVTVIAKDALPEFKMAGQDGKIQLILKEFEPTDLQDADVALAATQERMLNHSIYLTCKDLGILVNVADCKEECDFYFPGVVRNGDLTIGITAEGKNHKLAKDASALIRQSLDQNILK